jgi:hypothetical protein
MEREPVWNEETMYKEQGTTTFVTCGWCQHRGTGSYRYNCMLNGKCTLLRDYDERVDFDTKCKVIKLGSADIESIVESKKHSISDHERNIGRLKIQIEILKSLRPDKMPPLPSNRTSDHFNIDDDIMIYPNFKESIISGRWLSGKVINGYRHQDGCVSGRIDEKFHEGEYLDGHGVGSGVCTPTVMLKSEFDWFVEHPDRFRDWIINACEYKSNKYDLDPQNIKLNT